jgi:excisionase family DNA binding protein
VGRKTPEKAETNRMPRAKVKSATPANAAPPTPAERAEVLTLSEAAAYLRIGEAALLQAVRDQGLPARQIGSDWRFLKAALQDWLRAAPGRNRGILAHLGAVRNDPYVEELLKEVYQRRGRPETEAG